jgi:ankyrin repeat protein
VASISAILGGALYTTALHAALKKGEIAIMRLLFERAADSKYDISGGIYGTATLEQAAYYGHLDLILLEYKVDPNIVGEHIGYF